MRRITSAMWMQMDKSTLMMSSPRSRGRGESCLEIERVFLDSAFARDCPGIRNQRSEARGQCIGCGELANRNRPASREGAKP
ncbi:MAG: hypothetical protein FWC38_07880 [Proteobacteria bacterium]|nr:hypothetical protein [Pseudomonadota bacterium]